MVVRWGGDHLENICLLMHGAGMLGVGLKLVIGHGAKMCTAMHDKSRPPTSGRDVARQMATSV